MALKKKFFHWKSNEVNLKVSAVGGPLSAGVGADQSHQFTNVTVTILSHWLTEVSDRKVNVRADNRLSEAETTENSLSSQSAEIKRESKRSSPDAIIVTPTDLRDLLSEESYSPQTAQLRKALGGIRYLPATANNGGPKVVVVTDNVSQAPVIPERIQGEIAERVALRGDRLEKFVSTANSTHPNRTEVAVVRRGESLTQSDLQPGEDFFNAKESGDLSLSAGAHREFAKATAEALFPYLLEKVIGGKALTDAQQEKVEKFLTGKPFTAKEVKVIESLLQPTPETPALNKGATSNPKWAPISAPAARLVQRSVAPRPSPASPARRAA